ncbi:MAG: hypothetical protein V7721_01930 [Porticoccaceae bacterium]
MVDQPTKPTVGQILAALLAAALVPALLVGALSLSTRIVFYAFLMTAAHSVLLGLPFSLILNKFNRITQVTSLIGGFVVGSIGVGIWAWPLKYSELKTNAWRGAKGTQTMIDGVPTPAGWMDYLLLVGLFGFFGLIGGSIFWAFLSKFVEFGAFRKGRFSFQALEWRNRIAVLAPFVIVVAVIAIPMIGKDRTCHNMFKDTTFFDSDHSVSPKVLYKIGIDGSEWQLIQTLFEEFATSNGMSFRNGSIDHGPDHKGLYLSLCNEQGTNVSITRYKFVDSDRLDMELNVPVYSVSENANWKSISMKLDQMLRTAFPEAVSAEARD